MDFWTRLKELLDKNCMSSKDLADLVNVHGASVTGWKNGSIPRADIACMIAKELNTTVEYLITGYNPESITAEEMTLIKRIRMLDEIDKRTVNGLVNNLSFRYEKFDSES